MLTDNKPVGCRSVVAFLLSCIFLTGFIGLSSANAAEYSYQGTEPCSSIQQLSFDSTAANLSLIHI